MSPHAELASNSRSQRFPRAVQLLHRPRHTDEAQTCHGYCTQRQYNVYDPEKAQCLSGLEIVQVGRGHREGSKHIYKEAHQCKMEDLIQIISESAYNGKVVTHRDNNSPNSMLFPYYPRSDE